MLGSLARARAHESRPAEPEGAVIVKSYRVNWLALAGAVFAGAIGGVGAWYALDHAVVINGRGILVRAPWPLNMPVPFALGGAVVAAISVIVSSRRARALRAELPEVAAALGLAYEEGDVELPPEARPKTPLLGEWSRCRNRLSGTSDGVPAQMFDLTTIVRGTESTTERRWTVVLFQETHLPFFTCIPKVWSTIADRAKTPSVNFDPEVGDQMARQAVIDFQKAYHLGVVETASQSDEDEVRRLWRAPRLEALARYPGWHVLSADGCLLFARSGTAAAADRPALWREAIELRQALLAPVSSAVMPIPAAAGMERDRVSSRRTGQSWGCLTGVLVGFFGSFIAFAAVMFSGRPGPGNVFAFGPVVLGGTAVCALAGRWLGGLLADRFYRPPAESAPALRFGNAWGWVVPGAFAGWILGLVIGLGLATTVVPRIPARWAGPVVFFSPPALCLLLGGYAGYRIARWRAAARTGK
jgi:hypothetical protein